jgi:hypothetical protein
LGFSIITNSSSVFEKLADYVIESERGRNQNASFVYSSYDNATSFKFEGSNEEVNLTLLFRASEHGFLATEFHHFCDGKGPTITVVKAENERMAAAYNGVSWGQNVPSSIPNPQGFIASIVDDPGANGGYSLQKYAANDHAYVRSYSYSGPYVGTSLPIADRCNENENSYSYLGPRHGHGPEGVDPYILFGSLRFRVLEYEVYQVEIESVVFENGWGCCRWLLRTGYNLVIEWI